MIFLEILAGVLGGIVGGMGMGGGTLTIPILTIFLSYEQLQAQGINLIAFLPMSVVALIIHAKNHLVAFKETWLLALIGSAFSLIGALVANHMSSGVLKNLFAVFLIGLAIWQLIEMIKKNKQDKNKMKNANEPNKEQN
ncbi:MAG TPA: sulfite exporter TauE/SafE family protein [Candidatus Onthoplasma faecipullorum]|nr:sulfite exporter TauE/SafE family protein [Candidatus Onthoplasma faecipullorum]